MNSYKLFVVLFLLVLSVGNEGAVVANKLVNTTYGTIRGTTLLSRNGREISAFLGIPYGQSTHGDLRFRPPQPPEHWTGIKDANSYGPICPQFSISETNSTGDENCLSINVFVPAQKLRSDSENDSLPVLVYIHGGYFMVLSGSQYGPRYLLDHDIIYVSFNYRLGALGFLGVPDPESPNDAPGNIGIKDQVFALKWIQENIRNFGGDPNKVTIYGESAGGAAVEYLLLSPMTSGLFASAISGSGTAFKLMSHQIAPVEAAKKLAIEVGCDQTGNNTEMLSCLSSVDASVIAAISDEFSKVLKDPLRAFAPITETSNTDNPFLTENPYEILANGLQQTVPWMVGVNSGEGFLTTLGMYTSDEWTEEVNKNWMNGLAPKFLLYNQSDTQLTNDINDFYLNASLESGSIDFRKDILGFTNIFSDRLYIHASMEAVRIQAKLSPVYLYYNDYITDANTIGLGTIHGEELALIFSPANFSEPIIEQGHPDYEQSKVMVDLWVQFVTNPYNMTYKGRLWSPVESFEEDGSSCLVFANANRGEQGVAKLPQDIINRINFWNNQGIPPYQDYQP